MLRLFSAHGLYGVFRCSPFVSKRHLTPLLCHHRGSPTQTRPFSCGSPVWNDALQPHGDKREEVEHVDLDKWKSVMRSKAVLEEHDDEENTSDSEALNEPGGDLKPGSSPEATRDLIAMWRLAGRRVPQEITDEQLEELAKLPTKTSAKKYLKYLAITEAKSRYMEDKRQQRKLEREARLQQVGKKEPKNTFLQMFWDSSVNYLLAWRNAQAMLFDQPLVFDMSYESQMSKKELENTVSQLMRVESWNRRAKEPFHLHFCNLQPGGPFEKQFLDRYGTKAWEHLLITSTDRQHVDLFPRERLVYLTSDSRNVLHTFDPSKIYIIGALVDLAGQRGVSLANAKRLKLTTARLPLNELLHWGAGSKTLTLDQMIGIMLTIKETGKWEQALQFVPTRKHDGFHQHRTPKETEQNRNRQRGGHLFLTNAERSFKNTDQRFDRPDKEPRFPGRGGFAAQGGDSERGPAAMRVRTSLKGSFERKISKRQKRWWEDE